MKNDDTSEPVENAGQDDEELSGRLAEAVAALRATPVDPSLVERCRQAALLSETKHVSPGRAPRLERLSRYATAAGLLLMLNLIQAWMRLPDGDRQLTALHTMSTGEQLAVYSDLRCEPVKSVAASTNEGES